MKRATSLVNRFLSDSDAARLYRENPRIGASFETYCPTCFKVGVYRYGGQENVCDCRTQLQLHKHYTAANIGLTYQRLSWDDWHGDEKLGEAARKYVERSEAFVAQGMGMLLHGGYGTGKTFVVNMMLKDLLKQGYTCYATTLSEMIELFTSGWRDAEDSRYFERKIVQSDVLLLDEVRKLPYGKGVSDSTFDAVLRRRVQSGRPTLLTTNLDLMEMGEGYGGQVLSLLKEKSIVYEVEGRDFRSLANKRTVSEVVAGDTRPIF